MMRRRREADLVVDDEVDRASGAVPTQSRETETFGDDALARESCVAVDQKRQDRRAVAAGATRLILLGADLAEHDRIDDFEVAKGWPSARDGQYCRRTCDRTKRPDGISRRRNLRRRQA